MNLLILFLLELFFLLVAYVIFDGDIFSPPVITILVVFIGTVMILPSYEVWNVHINDKTIIIIAVGYLCCCISGGVAKQLIKGNQVRRSLCYKENEIIHWHKSVEIFVSVIVSGLTMLYIWDALRVGRMYGGSGLNAIGYMKAAYTSGNQGPKMNVLIRQGFKIVMALAYLGTLYFVNNALIMKEKLKKNITYIICLICGCVITIFSGSRTEILRLVSALILDYVVLARLNNGYQFKNNRIGILQIAQKFGPVLVGCIFIGFLSRSVVKLEGTGGSEIASILGYASYYIGSPIQVLNIKQSYFCNIKEFLFGTTSSIPEFVYLGGLDYGGNVASIFGSFIQYNGLIKMILYLLVVYFLGTIAYYKIYLISSNRIKKIRSLIVYSYCYFIFTMAYYSVCTTILMQFSNIMVLLLIVILYKPLFRIAIKAHH